MADCASFGIGPRRPEACEELSEGYESSVLLSFMVDTRGNPYEIAVIRSTGKKAFDRLAMTALGQLTFEPASLNGKPIESGYELQYRFENRAQPGITRVFSREYETLMDAISAADRTVAEDKLRKLSVTNFHEDAYLGLATYNYARKWGNEAQQLEGLERAIGEGQYLSKEQLRGLLSACMNLQFRAHEYAEVIPTWQQLKKLGVDQATEERMSVVIDRLKKLRSDDTSYDLSGEMPDGQWYLHLFKRRFQAEISEGSISHLRLRCNKGYLDFAFDPKVRYEVADKYGACSIELDGAPGTRFKFVQF
jgi:TonB family protein